MSKRIAMQSVLYGNDEHHILRAAEAAFNAAEVARAANRISAWEYWLGDCAPEPTLSEPSVATMAAVAEALGGEAHYEHFGENLGSAGGHNRLASSSDTDLLLILNPDVRMDPGAVEVLVRAMQPDIGVAEARQLPVEHPKEYEASTGDTSWASTACAVTRRDVFDTVEGFDAETFFLYGDDVDYSWRVRLAGYRVVFEPAARAFHDKRLTPSADWISSPAEKYYSAEASLLLAHKYSAPERVQKLLQQFSSSRVSYLERAAQAFRTRCDDGALPAPIDPDHLVARFVGDNYADHRY